MMIQKLIRRIRATQRKANSKLRGAWNHLIDRAIVDGDTTMSDVDVNAALRVLCNAMDRVDMAANRKVAYERARA